MDSFDPTELPVVLWFEVFLRCDNVTLAKVELTCRFFRSVLSNTQFPWMKKCEYDNVTLPPLPWRQFLYRADMPASPTHHNGVDRKGGSTGEDASIHSCTFDYKRICQKNPFNRNLAYPLSKDSSLGQLERQYGVQFQHGGNGFQLERVPQGCEVHRQVEACLATSNRWCRRFFEINLVQAGIDPWILDKVRPEITVREMSICRRDCAASYELHVQLLREGEMFNGNAVLPWFKKYSKTWAQWQGGLEWETNEFKFNEYPSGVRRVVVLSSGQDEQFWRGHYGSKFTNTEVLVSFPPEVKLRELEEFADPVIRNV